MEGDGVLGSLGRRETDQSDRGFVENFLHGFFSVIGGVACASINRSVMFRDQCDYREHCLKDAVWTAKRTPATQTTQGYGR